MANIWGGHLRNIYYTGHQALMATLRERLEQEHQIAVAGLGGIGKSELCMEYLSAYQQYYQACIWLDASSEEAMSKELTLMLKVAPELSHFLRENEKTLLILDNLQDHNLVPPWQGHLLFTTRFAQSRFPQLVMPPLSLQESVLLLLRGGKLVSEQGSLDEASESQRAETLALAKELEGYPLALEQAGEYLFTGISPTRYLSLCQNQPFKVFASRFQDSPSSLKPTLSGIIQKTMRQLSSESRQLLYTFASLSPDALEWQPPPSDQQHVDELLRVFLVMKSNRAPGFSLHRLVRAIIKGAR